MDRKLIRSFVPGLVLYPASGGGMVRLCLGHNHGLLRRLATGVPPASCLLSKAAVAIVTVPLVFYLLGFSQQPHNVGLGTVAACILLAIDGFVAWWLYRVRKTAAIRRYQMELEDQHP